MIRIDILWRAIEQIQKREKSRNNEVFSQRDRIILRQTSVFDALIVLL